MLAQQRGLRGGLGRQRPLATPLRGMRVTPPVHAGPLIAGLGVALVAYGTKLLMQALLVLRYRTHQVQLQSITLRKIQCLR